MSAHRVRRGGAADVDALSASLARAFEDDPVMAWLFLDDRARLGRLRRFFAIVARRMHLEHGEAWVTEDTASVALWDSPGHWSMPISTVIALAPVVGPRALTAMRGLRQVEKRHPRWPHWYLAALGTDPPMQGRGLGSAVMEPVLRRCDQERMGAYLESSKERNVPYYRRHGFEVVDEVTLPGGPPVWLMWREPLRD